MSRGPLRRWHRIRKPTTLLMLFLCRITHAFSGTDLARDVSDLRQLQPWRVSQVNANVAPPAQSCGIANLGEYNIVRLDLQLAPEVTDSDANSRISALDRNVTTFLSNRHWAPRKMASGRAGIPDLTRCSQKQAAVAQIYKTTGRCTMGSPCTVYDGFTVVLYLPKTISIAKEASK